VQYWKLLYQDKEELIKDNYGTIKKLKVGLQTKTTDILKRMFSLSLICPGKHIKFFFHAEFCN